MVYNCLRKPFKDPMTPDGEWNLILLSQSPVPTRTRQPRPASRGSRTSGQTRRTEGGGAGAVQRVLIAPHRVLAAIDNPRIIGVVSASTQESIKIYNDQQSYDKWLFFYGQDPAKMPEIVVYGQKEKD